MNKQTPEYRKIMKEANNDIFQQEHGLYKWDNFFKSTGGVQKNLIKRSNYIAKEEKGRIYDKEKDKDDEFMNLVLKKRANI